MLTLLGYQVDLSACTEGAWLKRKAAIRSCIVQSAQDLTKLTASFPCRNLFRDCRSSSQECWLSTLYCSAIRGTEMWSPPLIFAKRYLPIRQETLARSPRGCLRGLAARVLSSENRNRLARASPPTTRTTAFAPPCNHCCTPLLSTTNAHHVVANNGGVHGGTT